MNNIKKEGLYVGTTVETKSSIVMFDIFKANNNNNIILGRTGYGKAFRVPLNVLRLKTKAQKLLKAKKYKKAYRVLSKIKKLEFYNKKC